MKKLSRSPVHILFFLPFKPAKEPKRGLDDDEETADTRPRKRLQHSAGGRVSRFAPVRDDPDFTPRVALEPADAPEPDDAGVDILDDTNLKKLILNFEKRVLKNQELRIKYPDLPEKFMDSEVELNDILQEMHIVATQPELYPILVELNAVQSILGLLAHENTDISIAVVDLLQELTDVDSLHESQEGADMLIDALIDGQIVAQLVQNLERLDETVKEEAEGVHNTLAIVENLAEFRPELSIQAAQQGLLAWILKRLKAKMPFDANKLYCSEILSILLQNHEENKKLLGEIDGIDTLLQQLSYFKRHDPNSSDETEMMENLFGALCSSLMCAPNRERFLKGEGLQLMNLMLREKKMSRSGALKVLDFATCNVEGTDNCNKFVDILGLRTIFPLFMQTPRKYKKKGASPEEHEEHVCSVISSMLKNCKTTQRQRLLNKFTENDHEKVDRLMELHFKYLEKVHAIDNIIEREKENPKFNDEEDQLDLEEKFYLRRLDAGLFTLQLVDYIMLDICSSGPPSIKQRVLQILNLRGGSIKTIRNIMREYAGNLGDAKDESLKEAEQQRILQLVDRF
ncbi:beta-catenin-like protein 1 isoform X1 [Rhipicephalus sanguineus]|uniref:beta-catenin-like protein 1 isoform X1 n=1 Tax=Rhipicephalus sanguineus TaxID=34632 RepID=UPI0020C4BC33|nr:beta-catenin-like protein 1 isoform X1 [Rhipicephalus sanguineus]